MGVFIGYSKAYGLRTGIEKKFRKKFLKNSECQKKVFRNSRKIPDLKKFRKKFEKNTGKISELENNLENILKQFQSSKKI